MNHLLKLRNCRFFLRSIQENAHKYHTSCCMTYCKLSTVQNAEIKNIQYAPLISYLQIREYATKNSQGKAFKGGKSKKMQLSEEEMADVIDVQDYKEQLSGVIDRLKKDYVEHLSIRSAVGNIETIQVKINNDEYPLNEVAIISKKNPNLIAINMSDFPEGLKPAMQAIIDSGSGFNPQQDGTMIYVSIPKMTREHREMLARNAKILFTKSKEIVRAIQNTFIKDANGKTELSEDLVFNTTNQIMSMAQQCNTELEKVMKAKQKELLGDN